MDSINLHIVFNDGTEADCEAVAADMVAFESHFELSIAKLGEDFRLTHFFWLAWHSQKRAGATADDFDSWIQTVRSVASAEAKK